MERLTERYKYNGKDHISVDSKKYGVSCSNYCTSCGKADCDDIREALFKLAEYEDLEEQGRLVGLPCKVGDTLYSVSFKRKCKEYGELVGRNIECIGCKEDCGSKEEYFIEEIKATLPIIGNLIDRPDGFLIFLTRQEAEAKLAEKEGRMATEHIPQMDRSIKEWGEAFRKAVKEVNKTIEEARKEWNKLESEEKSMLHNVTIKHEENKALEEFWVMRAVVSDCTKKAKAVTDEKELDHEPTPQEIAQFLYESHADFVSVVQNYRFESELLFC